MIQTTSGKLLPAALLLLLVVPTAFGEEWTRFRGPNGTGVSDSQGVPAVWTESDHNWRTQLPGIGHSSPVIWEDRLFILSADPETATRYVLCIGTEDGQEIWRQDFPSATHHLHDRNSYASPSPAVDADRVYVAWSTPDQTTLMALDHDGKTVWQRDLGPFDSQHGFGTSPILFKDMVILCVQQKKPELNGPRTESSFIIAVDRKTGETKWKTKRMSEVVSYSVPCIFEPDGGAPELICMSTAHGIYSLDPDTGHENWAIDVFSMRTVSSPIIAGGLIIGTTGKGGGGNYVVAVKPGPDPEVVYEIKKQAPYVPCPVARDGLVFLWYDMGIVTCIRAESGEQVWQKRIGGNFSGSPVIVGDCIYCIDDDGVVVVLAAGEEFQLLGKSPLGEASRSTPAVAGDRMYLRTYSHLVSIGGK